MWQQLKLAMQGEPSPAFPRLLCDDRDTVVAVDIAAQFAVLVWAAPAVAGASVAVARIAGELRHRTIGEAARKDE